MNYDNIMQDELYRNVMRLRRRNEKRNKCTRYNITISKNRGAENEKFFTFTFTARIRLILKRPCFDV